MAIAGGLIFKLSLESAKSYKAINNRLLQSLLLAKSARTLFYTYNKEVEVGLTTSEADLLGVQQETIANVAEDLRGIAHLGVYRDRTTALAVEVEGFPKKVEIFFQLLAKEGVSSAGVFAAAKQINEARKDISGELLKLENQCLADYQSEFDQANQKQSHFGKLIWVSTTLFVIVLGTFSLKLINPVLRRINILQKHFASTALDKLEPLKLPEENDELDQLLKASNGMLMGMKEARSQLIDMQLIDKILANLGDVLIIIDENGFIKRVNSRASQFTALASHEMVGLKLVEVFLNHATDLERREFQESLSRHILDNQIFMAEIQSEGKSGRDFTLHIIGQGMMSDSEKLMVITMRDLSDIKAAQRENEKIQQQLNHASKLAALGTLGAGVAHELNNPLAGIMGFTHAIQSHMKDDPVVQDFLQKIQKCSERMRRIIDHLRTVSRDTSRSEHMVFAASAPVHEALLILKNQVENMGIILDVRLPPEDKVPFIAGNPIDLCSVIQNLIVNARDSLIEVQDDRIKCIKLEILNDLDKVSISVSDNGSGIPEEIREKIFEPFFTTKDVGKGTGLGLAIIHRIVGDHHGTLQLESEVGRGTKFIISIPSCAAPATLPVQISPSESQNLVPGQGMLQDLGPQESAVSPESLKPIAVVVDDDEGITGLLEFFLSDTYQVTVYNDPVQAVENVKKMILVDLLITDMRMPKMSGLELLKILVPLMPKTTFVMVTGHANTDRDVQEALKAGVIRVIGKPFPKPEVLLADLSAARILHKKRSGDSIEVIIVDDEVENVEILEFYVGSKYSHVGFTDPVKFLDSPQVEQARVLISDLNLGRMSGPQLFQSVLKRNPYVGLILVTGSLVSSEFYDGLVVKFGKPLMNRIVILQKPIEGSSAIHQAIELALERTSKGAAAA